MARDSIEVIRMQGAKAVFFEFVDPLDDKKKKEFKSAAEEAPFMIRTLGLGSGIAALAAKGGERMVLAKMICEWLAANDEKGCPHSPWYGSTQTQNCWVQTVLGRIAASSRNEYHAAQIEAMGYVGWIKKLAQAFCPEGDG